MLSSATLPLPLPRTLALVDADAAYGRQLVQHLQALGVDARHFADSSDLLTAEAPFDYAFYALDLMLPGVDGVELIRLLRRRTPCGVLVVSGRPVADVFAQAIDAGADMVLAKPASLDQVVVAIRGVYRRVVAGSGQHWQLDTRKLQLVAPDGAVIRISEADRLVLQCFVDAGGQTVTRQTLSHQLGHTAGTEAENRLSASIYRLRQRIERATALPMPLNTQARVGYVFRAELRLMDPPEPEPPLAVTPGAHEPPSG